MADQDKTEQASPRRRQKAREQGQVVRSRELVAGIGTLAGVILFAWQLSAFAAGWRGLLRHELDVAAAHPDQLLPDWHSSLSLFGGVAVGAALSWLMATLSGCAQGGLVFSPASLSPNLNRLNPMSNLEQLFSLRAAGRLMNSLFPTAVIVYLATGIVSRDWNSILRLLHGTGTVLVGFLSTRLFEVAWKSSLVLLGWSVADYFLERRRHENELKMSKQELREEFKESEGNPAVKMRIRRLQRQARRRRMLKDVERAAVVITNPTEFAIALEFNLEMQAPVVVAKGRSLLAAQIREVALWHGVPLVENPPLARALYRAVEVGQAIPPKLYAVIAEILAAIWRAQSRVAQSSGIRN